MAWGRTRIVDAGGVRLNIRELGEGPTILLLHDALDTSANAWRELAPPLAQGWRVLAPDLRGHGRSQRFGDPQTPWATLSTRTFAEDAAALLDALDGAAPAHVVGAGVAGGAAAQLLATDRPDLVQTLTLLASPVNPGEPLKAAYRKAALAQPTPEERARLERLHGPAYALDLRAHALVYLSGLPEEDLPRELLVTFKQPALVIEPAQDPQYSPVSTMFVRAWLNHAEYERPENQDATFYASPEGAAWLATRLTSFLRHPR